MKQVFHRAFLLSFPLVAPGCLIPSPIEEQPAPQNFAPTCEAFEPRTEEVRFHDPRIDDPVVVFEAFDCDDPNGDDRLFWRWFVDYNPLQGIIAAKGEIRPAERGQTVDHAFDPCALPRSGGEVQHRVDLIVADRPFLSDPEDAQQADRQNQLLPGEAGAARVTWFLLVDDRLCP